MSSRAVKPLIRPLCHLSVSCLRAEDMNVCFPAGSSYSFASNGSSSTVSPFFTEYTHHVLADD